MLPLRGSEAPLLLSCEGMKKRFYMLPILKMELLPHV
jgi:hypothetical protein